MALDRAEADARNALHLSGGLVSELYAVVAYSGMEPSFQVLAGLLGLGAEDRVAAANVGEDGVVPAAFVA